MLPKRVRFWLFETLSLKTMRYVHAISRRKATGLVARVYDMIEEDFFINGSLISRSKVPELMAGIWTAGRESILVDDHLDRTTKEAMNAVLSQVNECPYCGDMLISLVHASGKHEAASCIFAENEAHITNTKLRKRLTWVKSVATPGARMETPVPFTPEEVPEAIAALMAMSDINRFSHVVMDERAAGTSAGEGYSTPALWRAIESDAREIAHAGTRPATAATRSAAYGYAMGYPKSPDRGCPRTVDSSRRA